jgi:hypothetical protein
MGSGVGARKFDSAKRGRKVTRKSKEFLRNRTTIRKSEPTKTFQGCGETPLTCSRLRGGWIAGGEKDDREELLPATGC